MKETEAGQQMMWVHTRGIRTLLPPHATKKLVEVTNNNNSEEASMSPEESERLRIITEDSTFKKRFPSPEHGVNFMKMVSYERKDELMCMAKDLSQNIVNAWQTVKFKAPIAVILFGSVVKGLTRDTQKSKDPSNIDITVIVDDFSKEEKDKFMDAIRDRRDKIQQFILSKFPEVCSEEKNPGNAGVHLTTEKKVRNGDFGNMIAFIGSSATPLYDPDGIWDRLEQDALHYSIKKRNKNKQHFLSNSGDIKPANQNAINSKTMIEA